MSLKLLFVKLLFVFSSLPLPLRTSIVCVRKNKKDYSLRYTGEAINLLHYGPMSNNRPS